MNGAHDDCRDCGHWSDFPTRNEPAFPAGPGDGDGDGDARGGLIGDGAPGLALIHAGDQYISHAQSDLTAILPAPIPAADRARLVQQMARAFGVPLTVVDPHRMRAELELRATEPRTLLPVETGAVRGVGEGSTVTRSRSPSAGWALSGPRPILVPVTEDRGRVVVADDDVLLREGLASLLIGSGFDVVGRAGDPAALLALVRSHRPDLVIVDIRMPPTRTTEGLEAAQMIRRELPETAILVLSAHVEVEQATELLASGRRMGYLLKDRISDVEDFLATLDRILKGAAIVDPALVQELLAARRVDDPLEELSPREREVLALMAEGRSNAGIAHQLWVTEGTVEKHVRSILMKLRIPEASDDHRRVLAVLTFLDSH